MPGASRKLVAGPLHGLARLEALRDFEHVLATRARPVRLVDKADVLHQRFADTGLRLLTFGRQDRYLTEYVTTLGHTLYLPRGFRARDPGSQLAVLRHELVHIEQFERWGRVAMTLAYGLLPLPIGLAYLRARLELEAYRETIRATLEVDGPEAAASHALRDFIVARFVGADYLFMWPFRTQVMAWIEALQREALADAGIVRGA